MNCVITRITDYKLKAMEINRRSQLAQNEHSWFVAAHHSLDLLLILLRFIFNKKLLSQAGDEV